MVALTELANEKKESVDCGQSTEKPITSDPNNQNTMQHDVVSESCQSISGSSSSSSLCDSSCSSDSASSVSFNDSFSEDCDVDVKDKTYVPQNNSGNDSDERIISASSSVNVTELSNHRISLSPSKGVSISLIKRGIKRKRDTEKWKRNVQKKVRNSGKAYEMHTSSKEIGEERAIKPPCSVKCKLQCSTKFSEEYRKVLFSTYWELGDLKKQRQYDANSMVIINPKYRYIHVGGTRMLEKMNNVGNVLLEYDLRGKHGKQKAVDPIIKEGIKQHIESFPKIESHYLHANTSRHFIEGSKSIADIHKDYGEKYDNHLKEKDLSRKEKNNDKINDEAILGVYDLQAVVQLPKEDVSHFYYKSKVNLFNSTVNYLKTNTCECYMWEEGTGHRSVNELGLCVLQYLKKITSKKDADVVFYSDRQQKNKYMLAIYLYAVRYLDIRSICPEYLIKGHMQNEGDSAHSLIERQMKHMLKSEPMYTPEYFISAIRSAKKKGEPFHVNELCCEDFYDIKTMVNDTGPLNMSTLKLSDTKVVKVVRESP
ncbi:hypothetical protein PR048_021967 [Dryococelus australis]|uniref:Tyrosine-protein phosphatase domain-containing protein n=1 Tax=Dryococelus australis TaxID=614101 RepID=A0ABQ9GZS4_9NEOP|nr:hypothetical protein PR048_021967 [Dryococelus australis]